MRPVVNGLQSEYADKVDFVVYSAVNTDASSGEIADKHMVTTIPSMMIVAPDGSELDRIEGATDAATLRALIDKSLQK
jgi:thioredoxin-like negative regulator of GroEL